MDKYLTKEQIKVILQNAPPNLDKAEIVKEIANRGYRIQGLNDYSVDTTKIDNSTGKVGAAPLGTGAEKILNFTGGTKIAQGLGQALAQGANNKGLQEAQGQAIEIQGKLINQIKQDKALGKDTTRPEKALADIGGNIKNIGDNTENILNPNQLTNKQVIGDAVQLATTAGGAKVAGLVGGEAKAATSVGRGILQGAKVGALGGTAVGALSGAAQGLKADGDTKQVLADAGVGAISGAVLGGALGGITGGIGGIKNSTKVTPENKIQNAVDAVSPDLSGKKLTGAYKEVISGKRSITPSSVFTEQKLSPDQQTERLGARLADVIKSKDPYKNLTSLNAELSKTETQLQAAFEQPEIQFNADKPVLFEKLDSIKQTIPREFSSIKDSKSVFDNVIDYGKELAASTDDTPLGIRQARMAFDTQAKLEYPNAFKEGAIDLKTPAGRAIKAVRDTFNEHLYDTAPNGSVIKQLISHEADLYRANENIASKAAKMHGESALISWIRRNPGKVKALGIIGAVGTVLGIGTTVARAVGEN